MTPARKTQQNSHCSYNPHDGASVRRRAPVEGVEYDNFLAFGNLIVGQLATCGPATQRGIILPLYQGGTRQTSHCVATQPIRDCRAGSVLRSASGSPVRSISLLRGEGVLSCPNRAHCRRCGLGEREEQSFFESHRARRHLDLVSRASHCGRISPRLCCLSASDAPSAQQTSTSAATASLPMKRSWSCLTRCGRASGRDSSCGGVESGHARSPLEQRLGAGQVGAKLQLSAGAASGPQDFSSCDCAAHILLDPEGKPEANGTRPRRRNPRKFGRDSRRDGTELSQCQNLSVIGSARGTSAMLHPGVVDGSTTQLAGRDSGDRAERRSPQFLQGRAARSAHVAHNHKVVSSNLTPATSSRGDESHRAPARGTYLGRSAERSAPRDLFSSGDGLGNHQPGSNTLATRAKVKGQSGRAAEAVNSPAVARFIQGRVV